MTAAALRAAGFQFSKDLFAGNPFATIQLFDAFEEFFLQFSFGRHHEARLALLVLLEAAQGGANDFAGRLVEASLDLLLDKLFQFRGDRDVHEWLAQNSLLAPVYHG